MWHGHKKSRSLGCRRCLRPVNLSCCVRLDRLFPASIYVVGGGPSESHQRRSTSCCRWSWQHVEPALANIGMLQPLPHSQTHALQHSTRKCLPLERTPPYDSRHRSFPCRPNMVHQVVWVCLCFWALQARLRGNAKLALQCCSRAVLRTEIGTAEGNALKLAWRERVHHENTHVARWVIRCSMR